MGPADTLERIKFVPAAIWSETTSVKFWKPKDQTHVSHSAVNLQGTEEYIEVPAISPDRVLSEYGIGLDRVGLLKLDIEGAEGEVLRWCIDHEFLPIQLLVEFDEINYPTRSSMKAVKALISELLMHYYLVHFDGQTNCLFVRRDSSRWVDE